MNGVAGTYPGGTIWGIRVQDMRPPAEPVIYRYDTEKDALIWLKSWRRVDPTAELLVARIHWQVQPDS